VLEICDALDLRDVVFVGHSVSSMVGVLAAVREPARFARLVLVAPSPCYRNHPPDYAGGFERGDLEDLLERVETDQAGWARALAPLVAGNADRPEVSGELEASFCAADPWVTRRFAEVTFLSDNRADLPRVRTPSLVLQCTDDRIAPDAVGAYVHRHTPGSTLRRLRATGHVPHLSHPAETIAAIRAYLPAAAPEHAAPKYITTSYAGVRRGWSTPAWLLIVAVEEVACRNEERLHGGEQLAVRDLAPELPPEHLDGVQPGP
jgi:sigma-B regulation protein RsbQ